MLHRDELLTIGQLSERSGVAPSALRYYETEGLITATRTAGNQRRYQRAMLRRIAFVRSAQRVGLSLEEIAEALATLPGGRAPTPGGLDSAVPGVAAADRGADRTAGAVAGPAGRLHRVWLPEPGEMHATES